MKTKCILIILLMFSISAGHCIAGKEEVVILKFYTDPVDIYDTADTFEEVPRKNLPDPEKTRIVVENFDRPTNMVMFTHQGRQMWVNQSEVKLSVTAVASVVCTGGDGNGDDSRPITASGRKSFVTMGLGEGCK